MIKEIGAQYYVDGVQQDHFYRNIKCVPQQGTFISVEALRVTGNTLKNTLVDGDDEGQVVMEFLDWLLEISKDGRLQVVGHAVNFDWGFLQETFKKYRIEKLDNIISRRFEDTMYLAKTMQKEELIPEGSLALGNLANMLDVKIPKGEKLHTAKTDCTVTFGVYMALRKVLRDLKCQKF